jgi:hypothetical protein
MSTTTKLAAGAALAALALSATLFSYGTGAHPGTAGTSGTVPADVARAVPSCGQCHRAFPGGNNLQVRLVPDFRSLDLGQSMSITTSSTGGQAHPLDWGGFVAEATRGTFSAGTNSWTDATGSSISHILASYSLGRVWTYGYTAPTSPGPVALYSVVNTVDGDGRAGGTDLWGFHGAFSFLTQSTPVHLFVNAVGVKGLGASCVGSYGNHPVLGARTAPTVGNAAFALELLGAVTNAPTVFLLGIPRVTPIDLGAIGVTGCSLWVDSFASGNATTSAGNAIHAEGQATLPLPIPADPSLRGAALGVQAAIVDNGNGRPIKVTFSNAVVVTIQ